MSKIRSEEGLPVDEPAVLILDAATQHITTGAGLTEMGITVVDIPPKQTHCFQPADMFIISGLKQAACKAWGRHVSELFSSDSVEDATAAMLSTRMKVRRDRKYRYLSEALGRLSKEQVQKSWVAAGIIRAIWKEPATPSTAIAYDTYCEMAKLDSEIDVPIDSEEPADDEPPAANPPAAAQPAAPSSATDTTAPTQQPPPQQPAAEEPERRFSLRVCQGRPKKLFLNRDELVFQHRNKIAGIKRKRAPPSRGALMSFVKKRRVEDID